MQCFLEDVVGQKGFVYVRASFDKWQVPNTECVLLDALGRISSELYLQGNCGAGLGSSSVVIPCFFSYFLNFY